MRLRVTTMHDRAYPGAWHVIQILATDFRVEK